MPRTHHAGAVDLRGATCLKQYDSKKGKDVFEIEVYELKAFTSAQFAPPTDKKFEFQEERAGGVQRHWSLFIEGVQMILAEGLEPTTDGSPIVGRLSVRLRRLTSKTDDTAPPKYYWYGYMTPRRDPNFPPSHKVEVVEEPAAGNDPAFGPKHDQQRGNRKEVERLYWLCLRPLG